MCSYIYKMSELYTRCEIQAFCTGVKKHLKNPTEQKKIKKVSRTLWADFHFSRISQVQKNIWIIQGN